MFTKESLSILVLSWSDNLSEKLKIFTILETKEVQSMLDLLETKPASSTMEVRKTTSKLKSDCVMELNWYIL